MPLKTITKFMKNIGVLYFASKVGDIIWLLPAKQLGCQIVAVPLSIIEKIRKFFNWLSLKTVKNFFKR